MSQPIWGFDLGGTKIEGVILPSVHDPKPILRKRIDTEAQHGYQHIVGQIIKLTELMKAESGLQPSARRERAHLLFGPKRRSGLPAHVSTVPRRCTFFVPDREHGVAKRARRLVSRHCGRAAYGGGVRGCRSDERIR